MKYFLIVTFLFSLLLISCGPSQEERERQKRIDDSLMEIERNTALDNVDAMLQMMDSLGAETKEPVKD
jgi:hypothetical protein